MKLKPMDCRHLSICLFIVFTLISNSSSQQESGENKLIIHADLGKYRISKYIYGHFAEHLGHCIYGGFWVGEDSPIPNTRGIRTDVVNALKKAGVPVLRWPGGCFADEYHWKDGIGPRDQRPEMINTHWGGVTENNHFGTHEFLDLCGQIGCEPYICANVGSGTVQELSEWVEYVTFDGKSPMADLRRRNGREAPWKVKFWGIGNENWGCGGNMRPEYYADLYRRFQTYVRRYPDNNPYKIACGAYGDNVEWTDVLMKRVGNQLMHGLSYHYYTVFEDWSHKGSATQFDEYRWFGTLKTTLKMDELIDIHTTIMDRFDPERKVDLIIDEWGTWYDVEPGTNRGFLFQQNTLRDALVAAINLNIFNTNCDRVSMANIAQTVNVLQAMILTKEEKMILTPTYHVFEMYKVHQDATLLPIHIKCADYQYEDESIPALHASASCNESNQIHLSLCNLDPNQTRTLNCEIRGKGFKRVSGRILTADEMQAHNTFDTPERVKSAHFHEFKIKESRINIDIPPKSVVILEIQ